MQVGSSAFLTRICTWPKHSYSAGCSSCESLTTKIHLCNRNRISGVYQVIHSCLLNISIAYRVRSWSKTCCVYVYMYMLWTDCRPPVYKPVIQVLNLLARFQLYKVKLFYLDQAELFESWTNSMEAFFFFYDNFAWITTCTNIYNSILLIQGIYPRILILS